MNSRWLKLQTKWQHKYYRLRSKEYSFSHLQRWLRWHCSPKSCHNHKAFSLNSSLIPMSFQHKIQYSSNDTYIIKKNSRTGPTNNKAVISMYYNRKEIIKNMLCILQSKNPPQIRRTSFSPTQPAKSKKDTKKLRVSTSAQNFWYLKPYWT